MGAAAQRPEPWFDVAGRVDAPAVVLVHGAVLTRKMWLRQLRGLSDTYFVIAADLPGHGALAELPFTFAAAVETLVDVIARQAQGHALVVGVSMGGYVAMELARHHPELVTGLVLSGCSLNARGMLGMAARLMSAIMRRGWVTIGPAQAEKMIRRLFPPDQADVAEAQRRAGLYPKPVGFAYGEMAGRDFVGSLAAFPGSTLILNGKRDWLPRTGEATCAAMSPRVQVRHVAGAGHACSIDQPELFNQAVREFGRSIGW
jgi:pimeloyl-ACP methyl ester carboxylesterase